MFRSGVRIPLSGTTIAVAIRKWLREVGNRSCRHLVLDNGLRKSVVGHERVAVHQDVLRDEVKTSGAGGVKLRFKPRQGHTDLLFEVPYPK